MSNVQQLQQRNDQLQRELNEANRKIAQKEETIKAIDAENRRNVAKIQFISLTR